MGRGGNGRLATLVVELVSASLLVVGLTGCVGAGAGTPSTSTVSTAGSARTDDVIDFTGLPEIRIGATLAELTQAGLIDTNAPGCGPQLRTEPTASPVFTDGRLVLLWAYPPLHTPEGIRVGSSLAAARTAYPKAVTLTRSPESHEYPGLLVIGPDNLAYLFLHDSGWIEKVIVGEESYVKLLFNTGFGSC
jgi:hypothetical protein